MEALDAARTAGFTTEEWDAYIRAGMAIQDERGALSLAEKQGEKRGLRRGIETACEILGIELSEERREKLYGLDVPALDVLLKTIRAERRWP